MHKLPIQFYLPMPPSVSRMYINIKGIGRGGAGIYKKWLNEAERMVCAQDVAVTPMIEGDYRLNILINEKKRNRQSYIDRRIKAISDFCQKHGYIKDDRFCKSLSIAYEPLECAHDVLVSIREAL